MPQWIFVDSPPTVSGRYVLLRDWNLMAMSHDLADVIRCLEENGITCETSIDFLDGGKLYPIPASWVGDRAWILEKLAAGSRSGPPPSR